MSQKNIANTRVLTKTERIQVYIDMCSTFCQTERIYITKTCSIVVILVSYVSCFQRFAASFPRPRQQGVDTFYSLGHWDPVGWFRAPDGAGPRARLMWIGPQRILGSSRPGTKPPTTPGLQNYQPHAGGCVSCVRVSILGVLWWICVLLVFSVVSVFSLTRFVLLVSESD